MGENGITMGKVVRGFVNIWTLDLSVIVIPVIYACVQDLSDASDCFRNEVLINIPGIIDDRIGPYIFKRVAKFSGLTLIDIITIIVQR